MDKKSPALYLIYSFEAVARLSSFTKAAEELNVTRSTVSYRIQHLEQLLNTLLFERTTRKLSLSPAGAAYYLSVREALSALSRLDKIETSTQKTKIRLSSPPTFANTYLLPRLKAFIQLYPHVEVSVEIVKSQLDYQTSEVDFDIRYGSGIYPGMESRQITNDTIFLISSALYAKSHNIKRFEDLKKCVLLRSYLEPWLPWFKQAKLDWDEPTQGHRFEDLSLLYNAVQQGWGVALARESLVAQQLQNGSLIQLLDVVASPNFQYYAIFNTRKKLSEDALRFLNYLCDLK